MALPILDGNQSAATLSTIITGGAHIPAHTVVSLGSQAISDITSGVSGSVVSISNFPASQSTTFGAVTGSVSVLNFPSTQTIAGTVTAVIDPQRYDSFMGEPILPMGWATTDGDTVLSFNLVTQDKPLPISGTVTANGDYIGVVDTDTSAPPRGIAIGFLDANQSGNFVAVDNDNPDRHFPVKIGGSLPAISGTVTANVPYQDINAGIADWVLSTSDPIPVAPFGDTLPISGTVTANNPSGALTTRFGSVTTANTAQITSAVTNTSRKYLLAQNISAGTVTIGIGFSPTTTQGIQLPAGGGLTFDAFCPTGAIYWLGAVTGAAYTILEG